jgi:Mg2+ and Co2+ transporter CorA
MIKLPTQKQLQELHKKVFKGWRISPLGGIQMIYRGKRTQKCAEYERSMEKAQKLIGRLHKIHRYLWTKAEEREQSKLKRRLVAMADDAKQAADLLERYDGVSDR